jgi:hypothetical protein
MWYIYFERKDVRACEKSMMILEGIMLHEISKTQKETLHELTYLWKIKKVHLI